MKKMYLFFDIDGTLTDPKTRQPVASAIDTIHKLKANGHFVGFATGRPYTFAKVFADTFKIDHYVCSGGNTLILDGKIIEDRPIPKEEVLSIIHACQKEHVPFAITTDNDVQMISEFDSFRELIKEAKTLHKIKIVPAMDYASIPEYRRVFVSLKADNHVNLPSTSLAASSYHGSFLTIEPDDKYSGIKRMMAHIHGDMANVVVFGDGINDMQMFEHAPFSIAVGNAIPQIKKLADYVTKDSVDDGIQHACEHFEWI